MVGETKPCSYCEFQCLQSRLTSCASCKQEDFCFSCSLPIDQTSESEKLLLRHCLECAHPLCKNCGWHSESADALERVELYLQCPQCGSANILSTPDIPLAFSRAFPD